MSFDRPDFFAAPWPSDDLRKADGTVDMSSFPDPNETALAGQALAMVSNDVHGFASAGAVFFTLTGALDPTRLPSMLATTEPGSSVFLVAVDPTSPDFMKPYPVEVEFAADGGPFGAPNMLSVLPLQGSPLRPATLYAAVVMKSVASPPLAASASMSDLVAGRVPASLPATAASEYASALSALTQSGIAASDIAALSVFTTDAPLDVFQTVVTDILAQPLPVPSAFVKTDDFPDYCVYRATVSMPDYQEGTPPFDSTGGDWTFDATGKPILQRLEPAQLVLVFRRGEFLAVGHVQVHDPQRLAARGEHATLRILEAWDLEYGLAERHSRQDRHAVIGLLTVDQCPVAGRLDLLARKGVIRDLGFLQRDDVRGVRSEPGDQLVESHAQRIDVPGGDLHGATITPRAHRRECAAAVQRS